MLLCKGIESDISALSPVNMNNCKNASKIAHNVELKINTTDKQKHHVGTIFHCKSIITSHQFNNLHHIQQCVYVNKVLHVAFYSNGYAQSFISQKFRFSMSQRLHRKIREHSVHFYHALLKTILLLPTERGIKIVNFYTEILCTLISC